MAELLIEWRRVLGRQDRMADMIVRIRTGIKQMLEVPRNP